MGHLDKSEVAQHGEILFDNVKVLYRSSNWQRSRVIRECMEISLPKDILNQEEGLRLSKTWMSALKLCEKSGSPLRKEKALKSYCIANE